MSYGRAVFGLIFASAIAVTVCSLWKSADHEDRLRRLRHVARGVTNWESAFETFPFLRRPNSTNKPKLSWRVRLFPYVVGGGVYDGTRDWEDFDSARNKEYANNMPKCYGKESSSQSDIIWVRSTKDIYSLRDISDGPADTIMLVQGVRKVPWMQPIDISADEVLEHFQMLGLGDALFVACYDGSVHRLPRSMDIEELKKMLDPCDGMPVTWPDN